MSMPARYAEWLRGLGVSPPRETRATCDACAMCAAREEGDSSLRFHPRTKCCTYVPELANFMAGQVLRDPDPVMREGRARLLDRIKLGEGVTPLGIARTAHEQELRVRGIEAFGRSPELGCPYYLDPSGNCGIWRHRNAVCATWFCKYARGRTGQSVWLAAQRLFTAIDAALARHCVLQLDLGDDALRELFPARVPGSPPDAPPPPVNAAASWGRWRGREEELYRRCAQLLDGIEWPQALAIAGAEGQVLAELLRGRYRALQDRVVPERLRVGIVQVAGQTAAGVRVASYSVYDPVDVSAELLDALKLFDGRLTHEVVREAREAMGLELAPDLLLELCDFGLLEPDEGRLAAG